MKINWFKIDKKELVHIIWKMLIFRDVNFYLGLIIYFKQGPICNDCKKNFNECDCDNININTNITLADIIRQIKYILNKNLIDQLKDYIKNYTHNRLQLKKSTDEINKLVRFLLNELSK